VSHIITLKNITKSFKTAKRDAGMKSAFKSLVKREYTTVKALNDVSFEIGEGETVGYIGPNGAGKSSTIKIMCGIMTPDSGECVINNRVPWKNRTAHVREIGVVFGQRSQLWWDVPVIDSLELLHDVYSIDNNVYERNLALLTEMLDIGEIIRTPVRQLSLGQRMRCEIASSLLHNPKILFLDEPTIGLDAASKAAVREFIKNINREQNTTVILTTHDMRDIESITKRIILIGHGRIVYDGTLADLKRRYTNKKTITVEYSTEAGNVVQESPAEGIKFLSAEVNRTAYEVDLDKISVPEAINALTAANPTIADITIGEIPIDDVILSVYKEYKI
jgi:ABC-2 type transport system ATP-binding protein